MAEVMLYVTGLTGHSGKWFLKRLEEENYKDSIRVVMRKSINDAAEQYALFEHSNLNLEFSIGELGVAEQKRLCADQHPFYHTVSYTHLRAHETRHDLVCRLLLEKK